MSAPEAADALLAMAADPEQVGVDRETVEAARVVCSTMAALAAEGRIDADPEPLVDVAVALREAVDEQAGGQA